MRFPLITRILLLASTTYGAPRGDVRFVVV